MNAFKNILGYYKSSVFATLRQFVFINRLRLKVRIGKRCIISKDIELGKDINIRDNVRIGKNVKIDDGVTIGDFASINNISIGKNSHIESGVKITGNGKGRIIIGKECYIGTNNVLDWSDKITIGDYVHIAGPSTGLWTHSSANQALAGLPLNDKNPEYRPVAPITVGSNVYIGGNSTIYPGVKIGHHSIITPNSAITKDVESFTMVGGVPAKLIKKLNIERKI